MLNIDNKDQEELFKILESNYSSDSLEDDFSPNIKTGFGNSCCNNMKSIKTLTKSEMKN